MQAETRTLTHLFQLDVRYLIPLYQRPYVWTAERQWAPLWDDIVTVADHVLQEGASAKSPTHFLGAIVVQQQENPPGAPQRFLVIDGQQRLTTLQLLLAAAARTAEHHDCPGEAELLRRLIVNNPLLAEGEERFKVWPTNVNRAAFRAVMEADGETLTDDAGNEIKEAYNFFCDRIQAWVNDADDGQSPVIRKSCFSALRVCLSELLKLVAIRLEEGDSPQVIFETLNGRGTPLIALDLLKNAVFLKADGEAVDTDALYSTHWAPELDRDYWREDRRAGRLFTKNGDLFLQYWLVAELAEPVPSTELFDIFRTRILQPAKCPPMAELIPSLARDAAALRQFQEAPPGTPERRFADLLELLDTTTLMPLALIILRSEQVSAAVRAQSFAILEGFLIRRMLCGLTTKNYNRLTASLIGDVNDNLSQADSVLRDRLAAETAPANRWPNDDEVRLALLTKDLYGQRRQDRLVEVLWRIEEALRAADTKSETGLAKPDKLTLEHLIPQTWEQHWPLDDAQEDPLALRNSRLHRLGNLTLTTGQLNSSLSNLPWHSSDAPKDKRRSLLQHSLLKLNTAVVHRYPEAFDERAVDQRGAELAQFVLQIWPRPDGAAGKQPDAGSKPSVLPQSPPTSRVDSSQPVADRYFIREQLRKGRAVGAIVHDVGDEWSTYLVVLEEEARLAGELGIYPASPENVAMLREHRQLRWERIAARIYGEARRVDDIKRLYDEIRGEGASRRSYLSKGRRFSEMEHEPSGSPPEADLLRVDDPVSPISGEMDDELYERVCAIVSAGAEILTLSNKRPNRVVSVDRSGLTVETLRSDELGTGPQAIPAWMIITAWKHLQSNGSLSQDELLNDLNVKRSAFVCALLAKFSDVVVRSTRPTVLQLIPDV